MKPEDLLVEATDWRYVFEYAGDGASYGSKSVSACIGTDTPTDAVLRADVTEIVAAAEGENDGPDWLIVVKLKDGRCAFVCAGCDYTGWDCQAGGYCIVDTDLAHLIRFGIGQNERARLGLALEEGSNNT